MFVLILVDLLFYVLFSFNRELSGIFAEHRHRREALLNYNISLEYTLILRLEELQQLAEL